MNLSLKKQALLTWFGETKDLGKAVAWLASESDYVTDTTLFVDEGMTSFPRFTTIG